MDDLSRSSDGFDHAYEATAGAVARARSAAVRVAEAAGATDDQLQAVRLAVSEAVTNAVLHGHRGNPGEVRVTARVLDGALWVVVRDDGCGIGTPGSRTGMGIGLAVIAEVADHMSVAPRASGGTELRMRFDLGQSSYAPAPARRTAAMPSAAA